MLGNDDPASLRPLLDAAPWGTHAEGRVVMLDERHEMMSWGYSNITPWHSHREQTEEQLAAAAPRRWPPTCTTPSRAIVNVHVPPYGTQLDEAPVLDADLRVVQVMGQVKFAPVGSTAVRDFLLERQPLLGLHGHIHESAGIRRLGRTIAINPGSDYATGALNGALVTLKDGRVSATSSCAAEAAVARRETLVAVDVGTSGARAAAFDLDGNAAARGPPSYPTTSPAPGWAEQDPRAWRSGGAAPPWPALVRQLGPRRRVAAIGLTGQCPSVCLVDASGQAAQPGPDLPRQPSDDGGGRDPRAVRRRGDPRADRASAGGLPHRPEAAVAPGHEPDGVRPGLPRAAAARPGRATR